MDEDNKGQIQNGEEVKEEEKKEKKEKKEKVEKAKGSGIFVGLQFLTFFVVIGVIGLQYLQFEKIMDLEKSLIESGKVDPTTEETLTLPEVPIANIVLFSLGEKNTYNISDGRDTKTLIVTVNLGLNKKSKSYKNTTTALTEKIQIVKEIVETIITSADVSDLDGSGKEYNLKTKIISQISKEFGTDSIVNVYFSDKFIA